MSWTPREYRTGDEAAILKLYKLVFGIEMSLEQWHWKYTKNPAGKPFITVAENNRELVGCFALLPRWMKIGKERHLGALSVDTMVHPEYRGQGLHVSMGRHTCDLAAKAGIQVAYGFANDKSHRSATTKIGFASTYKDGIPLWAKPLNFESILKKRFSGNLLLSKLGDNGTALIWKMLFNVKRTRRTYLVKEAFSFDTRFDAIWEAFSQSREVMVIRDRSFLNWRYLDKPGDKYSILVAEKDAKLHGFAILKREEEAGLQMGFIMDIMTIPGEPRVAFELILAAVNYFRYHEMDIAACLMLPDSPYIRNLKDAGFIRAPRRLLPQQLYLDINTNISQLPKDLLGNIQKWFITWGDHDTI